MKQKRDSFLDESAGTQRYRSYTMNALDAVLTPGTPPNRVATLAVALAAWHYRRRLMLLTMAYAILMQERDDEDSESRFGEGEYPSGKYY